MSERRQTSITSQILEFIEDRDDAVKVEEVRRACGIGNWATVLNSCLELLLEGQIQGVRTGSGWVFWAKDGEKPEVTNNGH